MTAILGLSAYYHDAAAALLIDGKLVAAAEEERFSRKKHDAAFPSRAVEACLRVAGMRMDDVDYVGFYEKPLLKFERLLETQLAFAPRGWSSFVRSIPTWLSKKLFLRREIQRRLGAGRERRIVFTEHHEAHAASAFFPSPFEEAAIVVLDGVGEWATGSIAHGRGNRIRMLCEHHFPHSLGLLYSAFTYYLGFRVNSGEYKVMGLAPYGVPRYADLIREHLIDLKDDGSFRLDLSYFDYCVGHRMTSARFDALFGGPPRLPESPIEQRHEDLAASIQEVTSEVMLRTAHHARALTGAKDLCLAGGVALNCVGNARILRDGPFRRVWVQPAAGDAGGALGVSWFIWHQLLERSRDPAPGDAQEGSLLGTEYGEEDIERALTARGVRYETVADVQALSERVAQLLADQLVVGWFQGRMEFGPRALGSRSILADARNPEMRELLNSKVKLREAFRPFAPAVLQEHAAEWFELEPAEERPYMLLVAGARRSGIPAVTHADGSARVQTVDRARFARFHTLLEAFFRRTGCPVLVNTSFNVRGQPIVENPDQALDCFLSTDIDALAIGRCLVLKRDNRSLVRMAAPGSRELD